MRVDSSSISFKDAQEVLEMFHSNRLHQLIRILQNQFVNEYSLYLDDVEWNLIKSPTTFVHNHEYHRSALVLIILQNDCLIEFEDNEVLFADTINTISRFTSHSFVLRPINNKTVYYLLFRSKRF